MPHGSQTAVNDGWMSEGAGKISVQGLKVLYCNTSGSLVMGGIPGQWTMSPSIIILAAGGHLVIGGRVPRGDR